MSACEICAAPAAEGDAFCTACGAYLDVTAAPPPRTTAAPPMVRPRPVPILVSCSSCGAPNASSRTRCGRCEVGLDGTLPAPERAGERIAERMPRESSGGPAILVLVAVVVSLVALGVLGTILSARGVGLFAGPSQAVIDDALRTVSVLAIEVSSAVATDEEGCCAAEHLLDVQPSTVWRPEGDGEGAWVELFLAESVAVRRVIVHNGDQRAGAFTDVGRAGRVRIDVGGDRFSARLRDAPGPQAIDLPRPVDADRLRITVQSVVPGRRAEGIAMSGVEVQTDDE